MMSKKLLFAICVVFALCVAAILSCGKEEPIVVVDRVYGNAIRLVPDNLPTMLGDICYELWLLDVDYDTTLAGSDTSATRVVQEEMSLGRFYWDRYRYEFYDLNLGLIDDVFPTDGDRNVYDFNVVMITLEPLEDDGIRANNGLIYDNIEFGQPVHGIFNFFGEMSLEVVMRLRDPDEPVTADYVLGTHSDDGNPVTKRASGLWFYSMVQGQIAPEFRHTLRLPAFTDNANFVYEGWIWMPSKFPRPISTGKFKNPYLQDWNNPYAGSHSYPNLPGEDFLYNPPADFASLFPLQLIGDNTGSDTVFITIEPYPDPDPEAPFALRIFDRGDLPTDSNGLSRTYSMKNMYGTLPSFDAEVLEL